MSPATRLSSQSFLVTHVWFIDSIGTFVDWTVADGVEKGKAVETETDVDKDDVVGWAAVDVVVEEFDEALVVSSVYNTDGFGDVVVGEFVAAGVEENDGVDDDVDCEFDSSSEDVGCVTASGCTLIAFEMFTPGVEGGNEYDESDVVNVLWLAFDELWSAKGSCVAFVSAAVASSEITCTKLGFHISNTEHYVEELLHFCVRVYSMLKNNRWKILIANTFRCQLWMQCP